MLWMLLGAGAWAGTACWVPNPTFSVGVTELGAITAEQARRNEEARAANEMRQPDLTLIPRNGYVLLRIGRNTLGLAEESGHELVIASNGVEVARVAGDTGPGGVPSAPAGRYSLWTSVLSVAVPDDAVFPIVVYAIDKVVTHRCAWSVDERGRVRRFRKGGPPLTPAGG